MDLIAQFRETLINSSYRRRPVSNSLKPLDSGIRQNDGNRINQSFLRCKFSAAMLLLALVGLTGCASTPSFTEPPSSATPPVAPKPDDHRAPSRRALAIAASMIGTPYRYGGTSPRGFDCSGLVYYAYSRIGIQTPRTTREQYRQIQRIRMSELQPGNLIFFTLSGNRVSHVGIYAGDDRFIHAPSSGKSVTYSSLRNPFWQARIAGAGRLPETP